MKNISSITDCYGCGVCAIVCPVKIIEISLNDSGFYVPTITNFDKCINCGLCIDVCAYSNDDLSVDNSPIKCYAAWTKDEEVRTKSSSGGIAFELGRSLINSGYKACVCRYDAIAMRAVHYMANSISELEESTSSKYIPSYTISGFKNINRNDFFYVTGTPCQIDSLRRYIKKQRIEDHFILLDFFCHGIPSMNLWYKYISEKESSIGKIISASWRDKKYGWHDSWNISLIGERNVWEKRWTTGDLFYLFFLENQCLGKSCYAKCKYKMDKSAADIRVGDLWGRKYSDNNEGVSGCVTYTTKGEEVLSKLSECKFIPETFSTVSEGQMKKSPIKPWIYSLVIKLLNSSISLKRIYWLVGLYHITYLPVRIIRKIKRLILR